MLSKNSHFSLHDGHSLGWVSSSNVYPQLEHFQLGMINTSCVQENRDQRDICMRSNGLSSKPNADHLAGDKSLIHLFIGHFQIRHSGLHPQRIYAFQAPWRLQYSRAVILSPAIIKTASGASPGFKNCR